MHMISKKDLNDAEVDTLTKSCSPTLVITAIGEVQVHEEHTVFVEELEIFGMNRAQRCDGHKRHQSEGGLGCIICATRVAIVAQVCAARKKPLCLVF